MESKFSPAKVQEHLAVLERRGVDGIILFAFNDLDYAAMAPLKEKLVLVAREYPGFSSVCFDDAGAVRTWASLPLAASATSPIWGWMPRISPPASAASTPISLTAQSRD